MVFSILHNIGEDKEDDVTESTSSDQDHSKDGQNNKGTVLADTFSNLRIAFFAIFAEESLISFITGLIRVQSSKAGLFVRAFESFS